MSKRHHVLFEALMIPIPIVKRIRLHKPAAIKLSLVLLMLLSAELVEFSWPPPTTAMAAAADSADAADSALIDHYFSAVNLALMTGTTGSLDAIIAVDFVEHDPQPGCEANRHGLYASLRMLRVITLGLRFQVLSVLAKDGLVVARVTMVDVEISSMTGQNVSAAQLTTDTEVFRVENNQIVEHWRNETG
jgi:hypothetical protein